MIDTIVSSFLYFGMFIGVIMIVNPMLKGFVTRSRNRIHSTRENIEGSDTSRYIQRLLMTTMQKSDSYSVFTFYITSFTLYFLAFLAAYKAGFSLGSLIALPLIVGLLPFLFLQIRLYTIRLESSYEGDIVVRALLNNYKISHKNMFDTLDQTVKDLPGNFYARKSLKELAYRARTYRSREELREIVMDFNYSIDTQWSLDLANAILIAIEEGYDISPSLEDIQGRFIILKEIIEQQKRFNHEGQMLAKWVTPLMYLMTVLFMFYYLGFTLEEYIQNQFLHPLGLKFAIYTAISMFVGIGLYLLNKRPKNDF